MDKITFNKIKNGNIFSTDYENLERNNEISFDKDIAVLYGPNGTGKTSLLKVLSGEDGTSLNFDYNEQEYENGQEVFMIIHDQNDRNIISGEAKDFLLGDNIKREFELKDRIKETRGALVKSIIDDLKTNYQISAKSSPIISCISDENLKKLVQDLANNKKKDDGYLTGNLIDLIKYATSENLIECDEARMRYFVVDYSAKNSLLRQIEALCNGDIPATEGIQEIEENSEAIKILQRFHDSDHCIVCDNEDVDFDALLQSKSSNRKRIIDRVASLVAHSVISAALNTSCVRIPQLSEKISLNTARMASAIRVESPGKDSGLKPTGLSSAGLITTASSARFAGIRSKILVTRSAFGSSTKTLRPALMSARMRFSIAVDLPEPVGPRMIVCSSEASGEILSF